jgi:hypothetical protein
MAKSDGPVLDMTPDGKFIDPPSLSLWNWVFRLFCFGLVLGMAVALVRLALWFLPVLLLLGGISYLLTRLKSW